MGLCQLIAWISTYFFLQKCNIQWHDNTARESLCFLRNFNISFHVSIQLIEKVQSIYIQALTVLIETFSH